MDTQAQQFSSKYSSTAALMTALDNASIESSQNWEAETTTWTFGDDSKIIISGQEVMTEAPGVSFREANAFIQRALAEARREDEEVKALIMCRSRKIENEMKTIKDRIGKTVFPSISDDMLLSIKENDEKNLRKEIAEMRKHISDIEKRLDGEMPALLA